MFKAMAARLALGAAGAGAAGAAEDGAVDAPAAAAGREIGADADADADAIDDNRPQDGAAGGAAAEPEGRAGRSPRRREEATPRDGTAVAPGSPLTRGMAREARLAAVVGTSAGGARAEAGATVLDLNAVARFQVERAKLVPHRVPAQQERVHAVMRSLGSVSGVATTPGTSGVPAGSPAGMDSIAALKVHSIVTRRIARPSAMRILADALGEPAVKLPERAVTKLDSIADVLRDFPCIAIMPEVQSVQLWHTGYALCAVCGANVILSSWSWGRHVTAPKHKEAALPGRPQQARLELQPVVPLPVDATRTLSAKAILATLRGAVVNVLAGYGMSASHIGAVFSPAVIRALAKMPPNFFAETTLREQTVTRIELMLAQMRKVVGPLNDFVVSMDKCTSDTGEHSPFLAIVVSHADLPADIRIVVPLTDYAPVLTPNDGVHIAATLHTAVKSIGIVGNARRQLRFLFVTDAEPVNGTTVKEFGRRLRADGFDAVIRHVFCLAHAANNFGDAISEYANFRHVKTVLKMLGQVMYQGNSGSAFRKTAAALGVRASSLNHSETRWDWFPRLIERLMTDVEGSVSVDGLGHAKLDANGNAVWDDSKVVLRYNQVYVLLLLKLRATDRGDANSAKRVKYLVDEFSSPTFFAHVAALHVLFKGYAAALTRAQAGLTYTGKKGCDTPSAAVYAQRFVDRMENCGSMQGAKNLSTEVASLLHAQLQRFSSTPELFQAMDDILAKAMGNAAHNPRTKAEFYMTNIVPDIIDGEMKKVQVSVFEAIRDAQEGPTLPNLKRALLNARRMDAFRPYMPPKLLPNGAQTDLKVAASILCVDVAELTVDIIIEYDKYSTDWHTSPRAFREDLLGHTAWRSQWAMSSFPSLAVLAFRSVHCVPSSALAEGVVSILGHVGEESTARHQSDESAANAVFARGNKHWAMLALADASKVAASLDSVIPAPTRRCAGADAESFLVDAHGGHAESIGNAASYTEEQMGVPGSGDGFGADGGGADEGADKGESARGVDEENVDGADGSGSILSDEDSKDMGEDVEDDVGGTYKNLREWEAAVRACGGDPDDMDPPAKFEDDEDDEDDVSDDGFVRRKPLKSKSARKKGGARKAGGGGGAGAGDALGVKRAREGAGMGAPAAKRLAAAAPALLAAARHPASAVTAAAPPPAHVGVIRAGVARNDLVAKYGMSAVKAAYGGALGNPIPGANEAERVACVEARILAARATAQGVAKTFFAPREGLAALRQPAPRQLPALQELVMQLLLARGVTTVIPVEGDGNCLFRALADIIFGKADRHEDVRVAVYSAFEEMSNKGLLPLDDDVLLHVIKGKKVVKKGDVVEFARRMTKVAKSGSDTKQWGGDEVFPIVARLTGRPVVYFSRTMKSVNGVKMTIDTELQARVWDATREDMEYDLPHPQLPPSDAICVYFSGVDCHYYSARLGTWENYTVDNLDPWEP